MARLRKYSTAPDPQPEDIKRAPLEEAPYEFEDIEKRFCAHRFLRVYQRVMRAMVLYTLYFFQLFFLCFTIHSLVEYEAYVEERAGHLPSGVYSLVHNPIQNLFYKEDPTVVQQLGSFIWRLVGLESFFVNFWFIMKFSIGFYLSVPLFAATYFKEKPFDK